MRQTRFSSDERRRRAGAAGRLPVGMVLALALGCMGGGCSPAEQAGDVLPGSPSVAAPELLQVTPALAASTGGEEVLVGGRGFARGAVVRIGGQPAPRVQWVSPEALRVQVPALPGGLGAVALQVQNPDGGSAHSEALLSYFAGVANLGARVDVSVGRSPAVLQLKDLNADGLPDLVGVYQEQAGSVVRVALGKKGGDFGRDMEYPATKEVYGMAVDDVDGDGKPDVVLANFNESTLRVLKNQGGGMLKAQPDVKTGAYPTAVVSAPLTRGAARPALMTADFVGSSVSVFVPRGEGYEVRTTALPFQPYRLATGHLDKDANLDLVISTNAGSTIYVLQGNGDGTFQAPRSYRTGATPIGVALADVEQDGALDIIVANRDEDKATVLGGRGDGQFTLKAEYVVPGQPGDVRVMDVDGDGQQDLVFAAQKQGMLQLLRAVGEGQFMPAQSYVVRATVSTLAVGDINGDKRPDVVAGSVGDYSSVLFNISR